MHNYHSEFLPLIVLLWHNIIMSHPEIYHNPEAEYAARLETIIRFGQTAVFHETDYQVFNDVGGTFHVDAYDELHDLTEERLRLGQSHTENAYERVLGLMGISPREAYCDARLLVRYHMDDTGSDRFYKMHMLSLDIGGKQQIEARQFLLEWNDYFTGTGLGFLQFGQTILTDRQVYPKQDDLTRNIDRYFAEREYGNSWPLQSLISSALIGSKAAGRHIEGVAKETATDPMLKELLTQVIRRHQLIRKRPESELVPGQLSDAELDMVTRVLFRATNRPS